MSVEESVRPDHGLAELHLANKCTRIEGKGHITPSGFIIKGGGHCHCTVTDYNRNVLRGCFGRNGSDQKPCSVCGPYEIEMMNGTAPIIEAFALAKFDREVQNWYVDAYKIVVRVSRKVKVERFEGSAMSFMWEKPES